MPIIEHLGAFEYFVYVDFIGKKVVRIFSFIFRNSNVRF